MKNEEWKIENGKSSLAPSPPLPLAPSPPRPLSPSLAPLPSVLSVLSVPSGPCIIRVCAAHNVPMPKKKTDKITIDKEEFRPRPRAPILPTKKFEDKRRRDARREKHKKDPRRIEED